ncbi:MAG: aminotransferase class III-fold pyridoxal phosphate-dependent enzyme [Planctomycetes bacterium]|nr:aminotransferase class III-fold pyridoxal phosphate-dependent enzyme [Planctomycetota bacterium]
MSNVVERSKHVLAPTLSWETDLVAVRSRGAYVECDDGRTYLDFACGTAVTNLGHGHPRVVEAIHRQVDLFIHSGGVFRHEPMVKLAESLVEVTPGNLDMFFFTNSGTEAIEGALKLARHVTGRPGLLAFRGGFHGRTLGSLSVTTSSSRYRRNQEPLLPGVYHAPYPYCYRCPFGQNVERHAGAPASVPASAPFTRGLEPSYACDTECVRFVEDLFRHQLHPDDTAAILIEPMLGEGGYVVAPRRFLQALRALCDRHGILLIFDEVQSGFGRTAAWFAAEHYGVTPDILVVAKGIANGLPLGAICGNRALLEKWPAGAHGTTFGGNAVACAAAVATVTVLREEKLVEQARETSAYLFSKLDALAARHAGIGDVRGLGLMIGLEVVRPDRSPDGDRVDRIRAACRRLGLILKACGVDHNVLRLIPPLIVTREQVDTALSILDQAFAETEVAAAVAAPAAAVGRAAAPSLSSPPAAH